MNKNLVSKRSVKTKRQRRLSVIYVISAIIILFAAYTLWGLLASRDIALKEFNIEYANLPMVFDGYKIVQISDYHNGIYKNENSTLVEKIRGLEPDIILFTGDIIDSHSTDIEGITELCESLTQIADVIWVRGNHYYKFDETLRAELTESLEAMGVISLINDCYRVEKDGEAINFYGLDDPERFYSESELPKEYSKEVTLKTVERNLEEIYQNHDGHEGFRILVSHRFTNYQIYPNYNYSLAFAGHSHGGQIKLIGGIELLGASIELFPKIKSGYNDINGMPLIVSSGLGTSNFNIRLFNPPEIISVTLNLKDE